MAVIGDVVRHEGVEWKVSSQNRDFGTLTLVSADLKQVEVPAGMELEVLCSTSKWPFVTSPTKSFKEGRITSIGYQGAMLQIMLDWVPSDMFRAGGSIFLNPSLGLKPGDVLVVTHEKGAKSRVTITKSFGSILDRKRRKAKPWKPPAPVTIYDRLTGRNPFEDDE